MVVGVCTLAIHLPFAHSLKEKRKVIKSLKDRLRARHNVSVAEVGDQELWQRAVIGIAAVGLAQSSLESLFQGIIGDIEARIPGAITDREIQFV